MTCDPNDPRLTAFVLGELDPAEHAAVETMLGKSADCRRTVEEIRLTVGWLTSTLHDESKSHARPEEANHRPLIASVPQAGRVRAGWWHRNRFRFLGMAAAILVFASGAYLTLVPRGRLGQRAPADTTRWSTPTVARSATIRPKAAFRSETAADLLAFRDGEVVTNRGTITGESPRDSVSQFAIDVKKGSPSESLSQKDGFGFGGAFRAGEPATAGDGREARLG